MRNLTGSLSFLSRSISHRVIFLLILLLGWSSALNAQFTSRDVLSTAYHRMSDFETASIMAKDGVYEGELDTTRKEGPEQFPKPRQVMFKSLMIPGWGQWVNDQIWKIPVVYAALGGLTYYSIYLHKRYHDYRAAFYNNEYEEENDRPFGPTPAYLQNITSSQSLKQARNYYRNRRDFIYVTIGLAYGLNAVDAYVFAHMRTFDVSDNLSLQSSLKPAVHHQSPALTLSIDLKTR